MYDELVRELRENAEWAENSPDFVVPTIVLYTMRKAADAIEELQHSVEIMVDANTKLRNQVPHWIPVEEGLPKKSGNYLTAFGDGTAMAVNEFMHPRDWLTEEGRKANPNGKWYWGGVTHWMPRPKPPKKNGKSKT